VCAAIKFLVRREGIVHDTGIHPVVHGSGRLLQAGPSRELV
jgi:hypothetical protein